MYLDILVEYYESVFWDREFLFWLPSSYMHTKFKYVALIFQIQTADSYYDNYNDNYNEIRL